MSSTIIEAVHVTRSFAMPAGPVTAVDDVSVQIGAGDYVAVRGPSGCGKSTLLHMLGCVDTPTAGTLTFDGRDVTGLPDAARSLIRLRHIGFVFQRFFLLPMLTAAENIELPMSEAGVARSARRARTRELLADEPTGELDEATGRQIAALLDRVNGDGTALVIVTHDADLAGRARRLLT